MENNLKTRRLSLNQLTLEDSDFIFELTNTHEWLRFIGDRNIHSPDKAKEYVQTINGIPPINYWVVRNPEGESVGIVTLIKKDYLNHPDIGFAFLPRHTKQGYAFEAASEVVKHALFEMGLTKILATTLKENLSALRLLRKMQFTFERRIRANGMHLLVFSRTHT